MGGNYCCFRLQWRPSPPDGDVGCVELRADEKGTWSSVDESWIFEHAVEVQRRAHGDGGSTSSALRIRSGAQDHQNAH
eukprot:3684-Hanusia_phi.AAC.6